MDLREILKQAAGTGMESLRNSVEKMSDLEKQSRCAKWRYQGISVKDLASFFGVTDRTIYSWLKKQNDSLLEELEVKTGLDLLIEQMADLDQYEKMCLYEASHLGKDQIDVDIETGERRVKSATNKDLDQKVKFLALAKDFRKMQIDLFTLTGLIPRQAEKIYNAVKDNRADLEEETSVLDMEKSDLEVSVLERLKRQMNI